MTFRLTESRESRATTSSPPTYVSRFHASGETNGGTVKALARAATPEAVATAEGILWRQDIKVTPRGYALWSVEIPYGLRKTEVGSYTLSFDTAGGTVHLTSSRETIASYGTSPPDHKQLIGVDGENVNGVDAVIPALVINVHFKHPSGFISLARIKELADYTGSVNNSEFLTFAAGEVLFLGARGTEGTDTETTVEYNFAMSANVNDLAIGDLTVDKDGHDYIWFQWKDAVSNNRTAKQPEFAFVERIYPRADLAAVLGFGA